MAKNETKTSGKLSMADLKKLVGTNVKIDASLFDQAAGETAGGSSDILKLEIGEAAGPFEFVGFKTVKGEDGDFEAPAAIALATGAAIGLPLSASFKFQVKDLNIKRGSVFLIRREPDAIKKKGKGKGKEMQIYRLKLLSA